LASQATRAGGPAATAAVEVAGLRKSFGGGDARVEALRGVDLRVLPGEFVVIMGPSGSGKSTLLHLIGGLDVPSAGEVRIAGESLGDLSDDALSRMRRRRVGFVFQAFNLLTVLSAEENVRLPLQVDGVPEREARARAAAALEAGGVSARARHRPGELSGGEQQRVAIARAVAVEPVLLLADEPTGNLDSKTGGSVMDLLRRLVDERGQTTLMVTHDPRAAARGDRIVWLRDGAVLEEQALPRSESAEHKLEEILRRLERLS
jgi:putative ABC transport system ATP-binding protein